MHDWYRGAVYLTTVTRYTAGPGTGKTHTLLEQVAHEAAEYGTRIGDLCFSTFARSQAADVAGRIGGYPGSVYPNASPKEIRSSVCTLHAAAWRACREAELIVPGADQILTEGTKQSDPYFTDFCKAHHLEYKSALAGGAPDDDRRVGKHDEPAGNVLFKVARYIRSMYSPSWEDATWAMNEIGLHISGWYGDPVELLQTWADYKQEHRLYEHDDYVYVAIEENARPRAPVLIVDEFQDMSPLQYALFLQWKKSGALDRIYVAGDPNQAIYGFRGADPLFLKGIPDAIDIGAHGDQVPMSRRCPPEIVQVADQVLGARSNMSPRDGSGRVEVQAPYAPGEFAALVAALHQQHGQVMILCRYTRYVWSLSKALTAAGIPHRSISPDRITIWEKTRTKAGETVDPRQVLAALDAISVYERDGHPWTLTPSQAGALVSAGRHPRIKLSAARQFIADNQSIHIDEAIGWFTDTPHPGMARSIAAGLDFKDPLAGGLPLALTRPHRPLPADIMIDTIHQAKGREAPAVILHTGYNRKRAEEYWHSPALQAEEKRVYYTGCTRASKHLVILDGLRSGPSAPPLQVIPGVRS